MSKYTVLKDKREKERTWSFPPNEYCLGTVDKTILTGDYTLVNMEDIFTIERKASTGEFSSNIVDKTFEKELDRMDKLKHSFLVLEFTLEDVYNFPSNSTIPSKFWGKLKISPNFMLKRIIEIETNHKVKIIFAGDKGSDYAERIFKEMNRRYAKN